MKSSDNNFQPRPTPKPKPPAPAQTPAVFVRATRNGTGGIATFILDGWGVASKLQPFWKSKHEIRLCMPGDLLFGRLTDKAGNVIDEAILAFLSSSETTTGFEQIELSCHGGAGSVEAVEEILERAGFERAQSTELLFRAHLNGKLPLIDVEAQLLLGTATTARQAEFLLGHTVFHKRWERLGFDAAMGMRSGDGVWRTAALNAARESLTRYKGARALLKTHHAVLAGPVNAGKSTLANRLARADRHIVSPLAGTTRDRLDTTIAVRGIPLTLSDTAGLRVSSDAVEIEGQRRARSALETAAVRIVLLDGSRAPEDSDLELMATCKSLGPTILVLNKADLGLDEGALGLGFLAGSDPLTLSAQSGEGLEALEAALENALLSGVIPQPGDAFTERQINLIGEIQNNIESGFEDTMLIRCIVKLCSTRGSEEQLSIVRASVT